MPKQPGPGLGRGSGDGSGSGDNTVDNRKETVAS